MFIEITSMTGQNICVLQEELESVANETDGKTTKTILLKWNNF